MSFVKLFLIVIFALTTTQAHASSGDSMNFRFNPIGLLIGAVDVSLDFVVTDEWTLGPQFSYVDFSLNSSSGFTNKVEVSGIGGGLRGNWFYNGVFTDGFYVGPGLTYTNVSAKVSNATESAEGSVSSVVASALFGYGWFWDSFNILLGGGFATILSNPKVKVVESNGTTTEYEARKGGLALEFSLGFTF